MALREKWSSSTILDEIDFKIKKVKKDTKGHFIMIKGIMHQEDITFINIFAPNQEARNM